MDNKTIGIFVGSLRRESYSKQIANYVYTLMPERFNAKMVDISNLPMFNQDFDDDGNTPKEWTKLREEVKTLDGFLFVTPEYNRSVPPVLKNALDVASRPYGQNSWDGKPGAIISVSPGKLSAFGANHHLRQSMVFLNVFMMQQPEGYISNVAEVFNAEGVSSDQGTMEFLQRYMAGFAQWMDRFPSSTPNV